MAKFSDKKFNDLKKTFADVAKKIANYEQDKRELPPEPAKRQERINKYKSEIVSSYNAFAQYVNDIFLGVTADSRASLRSRTTEYKAKVLKSLATLGLSVDLPADFNLIDESKITDFATFCQQDDLNASFVFQRTGTQEGLASNFSINTESASSVEFSNINTTDNNTENTTNDNDTENATSSNINDSNQLNNNNQIPLSNNQAESPELVNNNTNSDDNNIDPSEENVTFCA